MVASLKARGYIRSPEVERAMSIVPRHLFLPADVRGEAYSDTPLSIGEGQTISAPHMVAMMAEALELRPGHKVLEIGTGSGYNAAVMAEVVGKEGSTITIERHASLAEKARIALREAGYDNVSVMTGDGSIGHEEGAPYDRIAVTCGAPSIPRPLMDQLKDGGLLVIPVGGLSYQSLLRVRKMGQNISTEDLGSVVFVPLLGEKGHRPSDQVR